MMTTPTSYKRCLICGQAMEPGQRWLLLNRYGVGSGVARILCEALNSDGSYEWTIGQELPQDEEIATAHVLCWPGCATTFVELRMAEAEVELGRMGGRS